MIPWTRISAEETEGVEPDPYTLAKKVGIYVSSNKEFYEGLADEDRLVAALFVSFNDETYSFDVVVDPAYQRKHLGGQLIDTALAYYDELLEFFPEMRFRLDAVNPIMVRLLIRRGFIVESKHGHHTMLTRIHPTLDVIYEPGGPPGPLHEDNFPRENPRARTRGHFVKWKPLGRWQHLRGRRGRRGRPRHLR